MINIDINRISISLHGISSEVVEAAVNGLESELVRRLSSLTFNHLSNYDAGDLSIGPIYKTSRLDAISLRNLIVENVIDRISHSSTSGVSI
ncbi:hypothetical protein MNBD_GAMMA10-3355 [hydrothermal vent metagenome]|uniref:Uncharacterized protein n=1 Tax=hydrothermal vent metagenome TaxID=652676 RepID=A0A3B0XYP9_9ZZZZ